MNIRQMKYCLEIHRAGSLQKAAQNLGLTQPALTEQLQRIEKELDVRIFKRDARPIALTREGEYCIRSFEKMVFEYDRMNHRIADMKNLAKTEITIGIPPVRAQQFLPLIIPAFRAAYPQIRINYREIVSEQLPDALKSGSIDLAVMVLEKFAKALIEDNLKPDGSLDFACMRDVPFILLPKGSHQRKTADAIFEKYGIEPPVIMESHTADLAVSLASLGEGCAFCGETYLYFSKMKNLDVLPLDADTEPYRFGVAVRSGMEDSKAAHVFIDFCRDIVRPLPFSATGD